MTTPDPVINSDVEETGRNALAAYSDAEGTFGITIGRDVDQVRTAASFYSRTATDEQAPKVPVGEGFSATLGLGEAIDLRDRIDAWVDNHPLRRLVHDAAAAETEELDTGLTPEQDARVTALHQAAGVAARLRESARAAVLPGIPVNITLLPEDVLVFARWIVDGDATVEPVAIATAEQAADR